MKFEGKGAVSFYTTMHQITPTKNTNEEHQRSGADFEELTEMGRRWG